MNMNLSDTNPIQDLQSTDRQTRLRGVSALRSRTTLAQQELIPRGLFQALGVCLRETIEPQDKVAVLEILHDLVFSAAEPTAAILDTTLLTRQILVATLNRLTGTQALEIIFGMTSHSKKLLKDFPTLACFTTVLKDGTSQQQSTALKVIDVFIMRVATSKLDIEKQEGMIAAILQVGETTNTTETLLLTLTVLHKLSIQKGIEARLVVVHNIVPFLKQHASGSGEVQDRALRTLWNLAFDIEAAPVLLDDQELVNLELEQLQAAQEATLLHNIVFFYNIAFRGNREMHHKLKELGLVEYLQPFVETHNSQGFLATGVIAILIGAEEKDSVIGAKPEVVNMFINGMIENLNTGTYLKLEWETSAFLLPIKLLCVSNKNKAGFCKSALFVNALVRVVHESMNSGTDMSESHIQSVGLAVEILLQISFFYDEDLTEAEQNQSEMLQMMEGANAETLKTQLEIVLGNDNFSHPVRQAAHNVLLALWPNMKPLTTLTATSKVRGNKKHVMLSYSWKTNKEIVVEIGRALKAHGLDTWRDEEGSSILQSMSGSIDDTMAAAVENSSDVIIFFSKAYKESANCQAEARYANKLSKQKKVNLHFVLVDPNYKDPDGWLGLMLGDQLWLSGMSPDDVAETASRLASLVSRNANNANLLASSSPATNLSPSHSSPQTKKASDTALEWSVEQVVEWVKKEGCQGQQKEWVSSFHEHGMTGRSMKMLSTLRCDNLSELEKWMGKFQIKKVGDLLHLVQAAKETFDK